MIPLQYHLLFLISSVRKIIFRVNHVKRFFLLILQSQSNVGELIGCHAANELPDDYNNAAVPRDVTQRWCHADQTASQVEEVARVTSSSTSSP